MGGVTPYQTSSIGGIKSYEGVTASGFAGNVIIPLEPDFDDSLTIAMTAIVYPGAVGNQIPPEFTAVGGFQYSVWINDSGLNLQTHATNSASIFSKPFKISLVYSK